MIKKLLIILFGINVSICAWAQAQYAQILQTTIIDYAPAMPKKPVKKGACWNTSVAAPRFGAWACGSGKTQYDPCFSVQGVSNAVVCGTNPALNEPGFRLELVQPLPFSQGLPPTPGEVWMMQLANGLVCSTALGPQMIIQDVGTIAYVCNEPGLPPGVHSGVLRHMDMGTVWYAHRIHYTVQNGQYQAQDIQQIPIATIWQ